jgi:hypothetical protein
VPLQVPALQVLALQVPALQVLALQVSVIEQVVCDGGFWG